MTSPRGPSRLEEASPGDSLRPAIAFVFVAGIADTALTHWEVSSGLAMEANPVVLWLITRGGWEVYWLVKCTVLSLSCGVLYRYRSRGLSQVGSIVLAAVYFLLMAYHFAGVASILPPGVLRAP